MIKAVSKRHDHGRRQTPPEAASVEEAARPQIHAFISTFRIEVIRIDAKEVLQLFPGFFALFLSILNVEFKVLEITSLYNLVWPVASWLGVVNHLKVGVVKRLGAFQPFINDIDHYYGAFPIIVCDKECIVAVEKVRNWRGFGMLRSNDAFVRNIEEGLVWRQILFQPQTL